MATEAQVQANCRNAQKSTGPRTPEGKEKVSQNAVTHGLPARLVIIRGEDPGEFECYRDQMLGDLAPAGPVESLLAERIVNLAWRLQRAQRLSGPVFDLLEQRNLMPGVCPELKQWVESQPRPQEPGAAGPPEDDRLAGRMVGRVVVKDFAKDGTLDRLLVHERRIEHSLYRTLAELRQLRRQRAAAGSAPASGREHERREEAQKGRRSDAPAVSPSSVRTFSPASLAHGVTTNAAADPSCETKPIWEEIGVQGGTPIAMNRDWEPGSGVSERTPAPRPLTPAAPAVEQSCETNPILEEVSSLPCHVSSEESQAAGLPTSDFKLQIPPVARSASEETPDGPRLREGRLTTNLPAVDPAARNKANFAWSRGNPSSLGQRGYECRTPRQARENKPNPPGAGICGLENEG
jgi:hypothetical protein